MTGAGGLQAQIKQGLAIRGERVAIAGSGPLLLAVANSVKQAGGEVVLVAEQAPLWRLAAFTGGLWRWPAKLRQAFSLMPRRYLAGSRVLAALGQERLTSVHVNNGGRERTIACDRLACGFGLVANIELAMLLGCRIEHDAVAVDHWQQTSLAHILLPGSVPASAAVNWHSLKALSPVMLPLGSGKGRAPGGAAAAVATFRHGGGKHLCT